VRDPLFAFGYWPGARHTPRADWGMRQFTGQLHIATRGKGLYEVTRQIEQWLSQHATETGLLTVFCQHTSASLVIQENADPDVVADLADFMTRLVPEDTKLYRHTAEGPDDMTSHIRSALTQTQLSIPIHNGKLALGTWQGVYLFEHRARPHQRSVVLHLLTD
jgi:secondary thiamine-phosphate synthase enzyme